MALAREKSWGRSWRGASLGPEELPLLQALVDVVVHGLSVEPGLGTMFK